MVVFLYLDAEMSVQFILFANEYNFFFDDCVYADMIQFIPENVRFIFTKRQTDLFAQSSLMFGLCRVALTAFIQRWNNHNRITHLIISNSETWFHITVLFTIIHKQVLIYIAIEIQYTLLSGMCTHLQSNVPGYISHDYLPNYDMPIVHNIRNLSIVQ